MDRKKKQLLVSTSESLEKISRFLGINLSSYINRLYNLALLVILVIFLSQDSWTINCLSDNHCEQRFAVKFLIGLTYSLKVLLVLIILSTSLFHPKQFVFPRQETFVIDSILESYGARFTNNDIFLAHLQDIVTAKIALLDTMKTLYDIIAYSNLFKDIPFTMFNWYCRMCILITNGLFSHHIYDIYLRSRELNKIAVQHSRENLSVSYVDFTTSSSLLFNKCNNAVITKFRSIQYVHHELYILATKINTNFSLQLLTMSTLCLTNIIFCLYTIHHSIETNIDIEIILGYVHMTFFYALPFLYVSYICQRSRNAFRQMAIILHNAFLEYKSLRAEVVHFSLQLFHENLTFTALGLFEINIPLICSVAGAIITYSVMVIQLDTKFAIADNATTTTITAITTITTTTTTTTTIYNHTKNNSSLLLYNLNDLKIL
ncbi:uncharacterized protein [Temnothorax longispinosus]|uniref:uncharacterized protein isoform X1 n=1 Tax=Temnothorax longispinosus TaxID=300112 RepID=UPI003A9958FE